MIHTLPPGIVLLEHGGILLTFPAQRLDLGQQAVSKPLQVLMHLLQDLWSNKDNPSAHPSLGPSWKGRGLTMLSCSASGLLSLGPSMHSLTQHDSSLSLCWHSCAPLSLFLFFPSKPFFQVTSGSMSGFHKRQKHFSVKAENDTDAHEQGGWTRRSPEVPQPLHDLLLEKNARGRAAKN